MTEITEAVLSPMMGDLQSNLHLHWDIHRSLSKNPAPPANLSTSLIELYLRGMFEASGLAVNGYWSTKLLSDDSIRDSVTRPVTGVVERQALGWNGGSRAAAGLVPFTIVTALSMIMVLYGWRKASAGMVFDPSGKQVSTSSRLIGR